MTELESVTHSSTQLGRRGKRQQAGTEDNGSKTSNILVCSIGSYYKDACDQI